MEGDEARPEPGGVEPATDSNSASAAHVEAPLSHELTEAWRQVGKLAESADTAGDPVVLQALEEALETKLKGVREMTGLADRSLAGIPRLKALFQKYEFEIPEPPPEAEVFNPLDAEPATPDQIAKAEGLIRQARVLAMRGDRAGSKRTLDEAAALAPGSAAVLEALGDELMEQRRTRQAAEYYKKAMSLSPGNVGLEKKHAQAVFGAFAAGQAFTSRASEFESVASGKAAVLMSILIPGLGQIVSERVTTGVVFMAGWLGGWIGVFVMNFKNLPLLMTGKNFPDGSRPNSMIFVPLAAALLFHLAAILDARSIGGSPRNKPDRPVPPSSLPFE